MGDLEMSSDSFLVLIGLEPTLTLTGCADVEHLDVLVDEANLKKIVASPQGVYTDVLVVSRCGVGTIQVTTDIAPSCREARWNTNVKRGDGQFTLEIVYTGFYAACATWSIPVLAALQSLVLAGAIFYVIMSHCRPCGR
jgi:hypothetical protein